MKQSLLFLSSLLMCCSFHAWSQNLVQNPDFELVARMPSDENRGINCAKYWGSPTFSGSDYFHMAAEKDAGIPRNSYGKQVPHSGKAYAGICITRNYIEYLATTLSDTLIKGQDYLVEFYISRADKSLFSVKEFGVLFTNRIRWSLNYMGISERPSIDFTNAGGYKVKKNWTKLSAIYQGEGFETVLILGHFNYENPAGYKRACHYYIDDVSVTPIGTESEDSNSVAEVTIQKSIPQSFSPKPGETFTLKNIFFTLNKSELLPESFLELDQLVHYLNEESETSIEISGHTDNKGKEEQNKTLSVARAKAVADYLTLKGIDSSRISYIGFGSSKPIAANDSDAGRQRNRRVEFVIKKRMH